MGMLSSTLPIPPLVWMQLDIFSTFTVSTDHNLIDQPWGKLVGAFVLGCVETNLNA